MKNLGFLLLGVLVAASVRSQTRMTASVGERYHWHHEVVELTKDLARQSDRVRLVDYGTTPEGRPLQLLAFGKPEHVDALEAIQAAQQARAEGRPVDPAYADLAVVWLSYDVHGNEASCTEAALEVMAELADPQSARAQRWFDRLVVLLDPCLNPDGHDRYVHFVQQRSNRVANPDPGHWSHDETWPGGRLNHYLFDLNRDWAWARQPESQARLALYNTWLPHVHADFHEMGYNSPYYFAPAAAPYHALLTPWQRTFQELVGTATAADFDARQARYFTREDFDLFYPSYGDTYPLFRGAIGMTYEQGGGPRSALAVTQENGHVLTLEDRIMNHVHSSFALLDVCADQTPSLLSQASRYFEDARAGANSTFGAYVLPAGQPGLAQLLPLLERHGIAFGHASPPRKAQPGFDYHHAENRPVTWTAEDWIIPGNQPHSTLLHALMDPNPVLEDSLTYDITAWALPYAHGVQCYAIESQVDVAPTRYADPVFPGFEPTAYGLALIPKTPEGRALIARAGEAGLAPRLLTRSSRHGGRELPAGTVVFLADDQHAADWSDKLQQLRPASVELIALNGGLAERGIDLGSDAARWMPVPRVAVLAGPGTRALSVGEIWWHLEAEWGISPTLLEAESLPDLAAYDVLILPDGIRSRAAADCEEFAQQGGTVIALGDALDAVSRWESTSLKRMDRAEPVADVAYGERRRHWASQSVEGAVFTVRVDPTHPIGYLEGEEAFVLKQGTAQWAPLERGQNVAVYASDVPTSGFVGYTATRGLAGQLAIGVERVGSGQVVYFADNPLFRGFWEEGKAYFDRAVLFSSGY